MIQTQIEGLITNQLEIMLKSVEHKTNEEKAEFVRRYRDNNFLNGSMDYFFEKILKKYDKAD